MQHRQLVVFDIETIPDTDLVPDLTGFEAQDIQARRSELERYHLEITDGKNPFPRQPFHKVVAISILRAEIEHADRQENLYLQELRSGGTPASTEKELIAGFFKYFQSHAPRLVSYNGRTFDLPVLKYRAMAYGIPAPLLHDKSNKWENYSQRYALDWHCDLLDAFSDYGASARCRMNEVCALFGLPGKIGVDGAKVSEMIDTGDVIGVRNYCETDVLNTYLLYLRYQLHTGKILPESFHRAIADIEAFIKAEKDERPHLEVYRQTWSKTFQYMDMT